MQLYTISKNISFSRILWVFMALYFLNSIVDAPNVTSFGSHYLSKPFNEQESIIELVVEKVLNYGDIIPEIEDFENQEKTAQEKLKFNIFFNSFNNYSLQTFSSFKSVKYYYTNLFFKNLFYTIFIPPPEENC